jgi:thioredoxin 1
MNVQDIVNAQTLNQLLQTGKPVVLDFHAHWCGPCKLAMPKLALMAQELPDVTFVKINVEDADQAIMDSFAVNSLPLFVVVVGAKQIKRWEGYEGPRTMEAIKKSLVDQLPTVNETHEQLANGCEVSVRSVQTPGVTMRQEVTDCRRQK